MSFWESEIGEITGSAADAFAKTFKQIPDGTMALARIDNFANGEYQGNKFLVITWVLTAGDFSGQKVEQKLKVYGDPLAKNPAMARHRALNMLKLVYQLYNTKPKHAGDPTDSDLSVFIGKTAGICIRQTEPNPEGKQYNWVAEIHEPRGFKCETGVSVVVTHTNKQYQSQSDLYDDAFSRNNNAKNAIDDLDDIPF